MAKQSSRRLWVANGLGGLGYMSCALAWLLASLPFLPAAISLLEQYTTNDQPPSATTVPPIIEPSTSSDFLVVTAIAVAVIAVCIGFYFLLRLPLSIAKVGQTVTHTSAKALAPLILKPVERQSKKRQLILIEQITFVIKLFLIIIPLIALLAALLAGIEYEITPVIGLLCASACIVTLLLFCTQRLIAHASRFDVSQLW